jgi:hypothetical protein
MLEAVTYIIIYNELLCLYCGCTVSIIIYGGMIVVLLFLYGQGKFQEFSVFVDYKCI